MQPTSSIAAASATPTEVVAALALTAYVELVDQAVTDKDMAAGRSEDRAICQALFLPAAMEGHPKHVCRTASGHYNHMTVHQTEAPTPPAVARPRRLILLT